MRRHAWMSAVLAALAAGAWGLTAGCEIGSPDDVVRQTGLNLAGVYRNPDGGAIVARNSGAAINQFDLRQRGDEITAIDNNGIPFKGQVVETSATSGSMELSGVTTSGVEARISGSVQISGTTATLQGTWIEPGFYSTVYAQATVPTNSPSGGTLAISPSGTITMTVGGNRNFTASGGSGTYTWSVANGGLGALSGTSGASVTYNAAAAGTQTVSVSDGSATRSTTVTQN